MSAKAPNNHCFHYFDSCDEIRNVTDSECNNIETKNNRMHRVAQFHYIDTHTNRTA